MVNKEDFKLKMAYQDSVRQEVEAFLDNGGDLGSPEGGQLSIKFLEATNDMVVAGGGKPFLVPIEKVTKG
jgi:hypothetical protein